MKTVTDNFDYINKDQVFEHLGDSYSVLKRLVYRLKPGGIINIFVPSSSIDRTKLNYGRWKHCKDPFYPLEYINSFTNHSINIFIEQFSLSPISYRKL